MTHTLHRKGTQENLANDYVVFAITAQTVNAKGTAPLFKQFADIVLKYNPVSFGDMKTGNQFGVGMEAIAEGYRDNSIVHAVFTDENTVAEVLNELRQADLGASIVVSGLVEQVRECCHKAGIEPHTVEHSLGIFGRTELLPEDEVLEISTMCGHGMVAFSLIKDLVTKVEKGRLTSSQAAEKLAGMCHCGVFNPARAEKIIDKMLNKR
ncbi:MAG: hypothetical protein ACOX2G_07170 [Bacillota bacterium]|jgi:hypothetical protein